MRAAAFLIVLLACPPAAAAQEGSAAGEWLDQALPGLVETYTALHRSPELSFQERETAAALARILTELGFEVETGIGGHGLAGLLRNGVGPTVLVRTDMDALPIVEATGLPYASQVRARNEGGEETGVMHACGHDVHMTVWLGTATFLARHRDLWHGTLLFVAQPAEERGAGARMMLADGLYERTARPDAALALHVTEQLPAGTVGWRAGYALANVDSVDLVVRGRGGHGSAPHTTHDPIALAARIVIGLQHIVSREVKPIEDAVITVGSIHGGTKHNIIPDRVEMLLTVRSYRPEVREQVLAAIARTARYEALAAGFPEELAPEVRVREEEHTPAAYNDPALTKRVVTALRRELGAERVREVEPSMGGEDFGRYAPAAGCPGFLFWLGTTPPERLAAAARDGEPVPGLHTARFAPDPGPTIRGGVAAMTAAVLDLMGTGAGPKKKS
ncbi:MAG: amidohydrolase [Planctomycetota bacterium]|nr:MAG: amidohydrolase [Planctomycetota bacterium]